MRTAFAALLFASAFAGTAGTAAAQPAPPTSEPVEAATPTLSPLAGRGS